MDNDESVDSILNTVVAIMEVHNQLIEQHRHYIERLFAELERSLAEIAEIKKRIPDQLKPPDALNSTDAEFLAHITARLKAISSTIDKAISSSLDKEKL